MGTNGSTQGDRIENNPANKASGLRNPSALSHHVLEQGFDCTGACFAGAAQDFNVALSLINASLFASKSASKITNSLNSGVSRSPPTTFRRR
jgi:hypothetical protein